jgi:hypothetical protein
MTITVDSLLPRPKLDCDVGYDVAVKGASVVGFALSRVWSFFFTKYQVLRASLSAKLGILGERLSPRFVFSECALKRGVDNFN